MPYQIKKSTGIKPYKILSKVTGKQVGSSSTLAKARASVRARYAGERKRER